jgi:cyclopropane-fatty-acyl-phospholipid synthase
MTTSAVAIRLFEGAPLPDALRRAAVKALVGRARRTLAVASDVAAFAASMEGRPIAEHADAANTQHYELPAAFFENILGPRLKYSACLYPSGGESLAEAEEFALAETCARAGIADGQDILELGCGWGSLSLWMAGAYPLARILSVSNSASQRAFIEDRARALGLGNLTVITADMNGFEPERRFDRVVSVEMFEHMANWRALLSRIRAWLKVDGRLFLHVFSHRQKAYRFEASDEDWIGRYFFTGGLMPAHDLAATFPDLFRVEADWRWSGAHYARTARQWLDNFDRNGDVLRVVLRDTYGDQAVLWRRRWRLFFLATEGLFGHDRGQTWGVSHHLLAPV